MELDLSPELREKYSFQKVFGVTDDRDLMILQIADYVHAGRWEEAARYYADYANSKAPGTVVGSVLDEEYAKIIVTQLVHWCLNSDRYWLAARLLWSETQFDPRPRFSREVWDAVQNSAAIMLMGAASCSKSFSTGVWLMLDWIRDPEFTSVRVLGPSEQHLTENLFTHLVNLHREASIPLPGEVGDLYIGLDRRQRFGSISGVVVPLGKGRSGRLQGTKAGNKRRKTPHPVFGSTGRLRIFLDESEKIPEGIWKDIDNVFANARGTERFKIICAYNPENQNGPSGTRSEPPEGWDTFDMDKRFRWRSKRGWETVRLDGTQCENVLEDAEIFSGLQTREGIELITENSGGTGSPGYYTMVRAMFPPSLEDLHVITQELIDASKGTFVFPTPPTPVAACDLALEGGDAAWFALGFFGYASGYKEPPSLVHPQGREILFKDDTGSTIVRPALQVTQLFRLPKADSVEMTSNIIRVATGASVAPGWFLVDRTGVGTGVGDMLKTFWSPEVQGLNYSEAATDKKILVEDLKTAKEEYDRVTSELWFALRKWLMFKLMLFSPGVDMSTGLAEQLTTRKYRIGKINRVETKTEYKKRSGGKSPDAADAITLLLHKARVASGVVPSLRMKDARSELGAIQDPLTGEVVYRDDNFRVDATNSLDDLDV